MATYRPDPTNAWLAAVRGGVILLAPTSVSAEVAALWACLADADPTSRVLDALTANGLATTPPFALVVRVPVDDSARVVARGGVVVRIGDAVVSGAGVSTWAERVIESGHSDALVEVSVAPGEGVGADVTLELPLVEGVVHAASVVSGAPAPTASLAPVAPTFAPAVPTLPPAVPTLARTAPMLSPTLLARAEQTIVPVEDTIAGPSTPVAPAPSGLVAGEFDGDHDGLTVASIDLDRLREGGTSRAAEQTPTGGAAVPPAPTARLRMPDGSVEPIGHEIVLGRAPSVTQLSGTRIPRLVTIGAGDPDISRNHLRVAVEGDTVVVTDLHSRNGTHVVAPGKPPMKLRAGEPTPVLTGTVVDLGGGWTVEVVGA